jgi:hypothetical protein
MKRFIAFLKRLLSFFRKPKELAPVEEVLPADDFEPELPEVEVAPEPVIEVRKPADIDPTGDPAMTNLAAEVQSFLWKPESDTNPMVSVIVVSADEIRSDDLHVEIYSKNGRRVLGLKTHKNLYSSGRGNKLPKFKYGRINFKPGHTAERFAQLAPLTVKFYIKLGEEKRYIKCVGKDEVKIKDPTKRLEF